MWIRYFVPEDGDDASHPNVFNMNSQHVTMKNIKENFPINGDFHFRYLKSVGNHTVWMDVDDVDSPVNPFQGSVYIKASRISSSNTNDISPKPVEKVNVSSASKPVAPQVQKPSPTKEPQEKLLNLHEDMAADNQASASSNTSNSPFFEDNDLLGFTSSPQPSAASKSNSNADPFGLDTLQPTASGASMGRPANSQGMNPMQSGVNSAFQGFGNMPMGGQAPPRGAPMNTMNPGAPRPQMQSNYDPFGGLGGTGMGNNQQYNQYPRRNF